MLRNSDSPFLTNIVPRGILSEQMPKAWGGRVEFVAKAVEKLKLVRTRCVSRHSRAGEPTCTIKIKATAETTDYGLATHGAFDWQRCHFGCDSGFPCFDAGICACSLLGGTTFLILM